MTTQEKIHKMKLQVGSLITLGQMKETDKLWPTVDAIFDYLNSQGVVIKVDRELPESDPLNINRIEGIEAMLKADYVAVEPLIEEITDGR